MLGFSFTFVRAGHLVVGGVANGSQTKSVHPPGVKWRIQKRIRNDENIILIH